MIAGNSDRVFSRLMEVVGRTDLAERAAGRDRAQHEVELDAAITAWTSVRTAAEADALLAGAGVPAGPILDAAAIARDPQYRARDMLRAVQLVVDGEPEEVSFPGVVPRIPGAPGDVRWVGPDLGEHTDEVLTALTGTTAGQLQAHRDDGVI